MSTSVGALVCYKGLSLSMMEHVDTVYPIGKYSNHNLPLHIIPSCNFLCSTSDLHFVLCAPHLALTVTTFQQTTLNLLKHKHSHYFSSLFYWVSCLYIYMILIWIKLYHCLFNQLKLCHADLTYLCSEDNLRTFRVIYLCSPQRLISSWTVFCSTDNHN